MKHIVLSIIIPVYNEEKTVAALIKKVHSVDIPSVTKEIIVVNDASTDGTRDILHESEKKFHGLVLLHHEKNQGKGAALRTGFKKATGEYIVIQDADLEYDPNDFKKLMQPIVNGEAQVVYGTRLKRMPHLQGEESKPRFLLHYVGNRFLSLITSLLYFQWITDMETCYKIFPTAFIRKTEIHGSGFNFEPEVTAKLIKSGYKIVELPITTTPRGYEEGKKLQTVPEGMKALWTLIRYRFSD